MWYNYIVLTTQMISLRTCLVLFLVTTFRQNVFPRIVSIINIFIGIRKSDTIKVFL